MRQQFTQKNDFNVVPNLDPVSSSFVQNNNFTRFSLRTTIMFWFLAISLIPVLFISLAGYHNAVQNRVEDTGHRLQAISQRESLDQAEHFKKLQAGLARQAWNPQTITMLEHLAEAPELGKPFWDGGHLLKIFQLESNAHDILLVNPQGKIIFSCDSSQNLGINIFQGEVFGPGLKSVSRLVLDSGKSASDGFKNRSHKGHSLLAYEVEPVKGADGVVLGLLIMELGVDVFDLGSGRNNQIEPGIHFFIVDEELQLLATSDQSSESPKIPSSGIAQEILAVENSQHQVVEYVGLGGADVLGVIQKLDVLGTRYTLVLELPKETVLAGLKNMGLSLLLLVFIVTILVVLAGMVVANRMVDPVNQLGHVMQRVADGHEVWALPEKGPREICQLTQMFHCMISKLTEAKAVNERQYSQKRRQFELNEKLRGENTLESLSETVLNYLGEYFNAQLGVFYLIESRDLFRQVAQFGLHGSSKEIAEVQAGRGVLGQVVVKKQIQVLRGFQEDRHQIESGLVHSSVNNLIVAPIHFGDRVLGILELGVMEDIRDEDLEFLELISETVAVAINSARSSERVHRLLKETWSQAAILTKQQKDLQESNRRFELADQYKSEFLANMSHELRTPLNSLLIMSQVLAENRHQNLSREEVDSAMTINRAGSDLLLLINDILDLSKVEAGKLDLQFSEFELKSLLMDMNDLFEPLAGKQNLDFRTIMGPGLPEIMISDPLRLTQILKNILNNAFKFTEKGSVTFRVRTPGPGELASLDLHGEHPWIVFTIADTGVGMNSETQEQVFEAFNQGDGSIGRRYGGSGLGLSISRKLCDLLGGHISVESIEEKGTTFSFYLPVEPTHEIIAAAIPAPRVFERNKSADVGLSLEFELGDEADDASAEMVDPKEGVGPHFNLKGRRVLICEDDMRTVFQISEILDDLGACVTLAPSWNQGVAEGQADSKYDFAIISNGLADRPGPDSVLEWKNECGSPPYPVVALVLPEDGPICKGADLVGNRPLVRDDFVGVLGQVLAFDRVPVEAIASGIPDEEELV